MTVAELIAALAEISKHPLETVGVFSAGRRPMDISRVEIWTHPATGVREVRIVATTRPRPATNALFCGYDPGEDHFCARHQPLVAPEG